MSDRYVLNGKTPIPCDDLMEWARWFDTADRHVMQEKIGEIRISTVFLGLDHSFTSDSKRPLLFETMIFGGPLDQEMTRCSTWEEAEKMHREMVERVKATAKSDDGGKVRDET